MTDGTSDKGGGRHVHGAEPHEFRAARDRAEDEDWASAAWFALVMRGQVSADAADRALGQVLDLVRSSGEGPEELYGPADEWARGRMEEWAVHGSDVIRDEPARWRELTQVAAATAVGVTLLCALVCALQGDRSLDWTLAWVLLPFLGSLVALGALTTWEHVVSRHSIGLGAAAAGGVVALGSAGIAGLFALTNPHPLGHGSILWHLPLAAGYALLAWLLGRFVPDPEKDGTSRPTPTDDETWTRELARILRTRGDTTEAQVRRLLDEARTHAAHTGTPLVEEFGGPAAYAARVSPRPIVRARRSMVYRIAVLALAAWVWWTPFTDGTQSTPARVLWGFALACLALAAVQACWAYVRAARAPGRR
ncbi:hypothetical protein [Mobilicoccus pelagius]|uniref:Uncharacterized protein n=1 Tax=Mobilicoccus pelagius NBRC 104925 TaxID=1089455 RepID=H5UME7_9MICO|nr:hypothetical protein [Mobilicoccus pelagius]GAB46905.1 hypothetical protein MOPEL_001_00230 [Mobilicoccus pelagius NBRC 104925]